MACPSIKTCANSNVIHSDTGTIHLYSTDIIDTDLIKAVYGS